MKLTKKTVYIGLFAILYLIVAFSSFWHACAFFGLANNTWMSIILAFAFEVGQAAVLFSLLTSQKDRSRIMPWVLMTVFTIVQVIGNIFSSYKYLITNSSENLRFFKEPIFIWTDLPDAQTTVIITYIVGAILPICALLLTSMITNYLTDNEQEKSKDNIGQLLNDHSVLQMENQALKEQIDNLKNKSNDKEDIIKDKNEKIIGTDSDSGVIDESGDIEKVPENWNPDEIDKLKVYNMTGKIPEKNSEKEQNKNESHFVNL